MPVMNYRVLLDKLLRIQRAVGVESNLTVQKMLMDAEECLLELEKERVQTLLRDAHRSVISEPRTEPNSFALHAESREFQVPLDGLFGGGRLR
jgi:hypothetical protein